MPQDGINSISVPGMVAGWQALRTRFGTMLFGVRNFTVTVAKSLRLPMAWCRNGYATLPIRRPFPALRSN